MALTFPLACWVGLRGLNQDVGGAGYARQPTTLVYEADGRTLANQATIGWPLALSDWGPVDLVTLWDDAVAGNRLASLPPVSLIMVNQWDRVEIPPAGLQCVNSPRLASGFGTFTFGVERYGTTSNLLSVPGSGIGNAYGAGPYGYGAYERTDQGVLLLKTFAPTQLCGGEPADWAPHGPYEIV